MLEITSKATRSQDQGANKGIYAFLGMREYFQYDPTGDYLHPQLQGYSLVDGNYFPVSPNALADGTFSLHSEVLGLELRLEAGKLRFYNPVTSQNLLSHEEEAAARQAAEERAHRLAAKLRKLNINPDNL